MLPAHTMMYLACRNCSGSVPSLTPYTDSKPASPAEEQIVRSSCDAPSRWKNRRSMDAPLRTPRVPPNEYGRIASLPNSAEIARNREEIVSRASSQEIRSHACWLGVETAAIGGLGPLGPTLRIGNSTRSGEYTRSRYFATFAH